MRQRKIALVLVFALTWFGAIGQSLTHGLQAHYYFDGDLLDATTNNHDLQPVSGSISYNAVTSTDSSIDFDGLSAVSSISNFDNSSFTAMAVSLWVKSNKITPDLQICLQGAFMGFGAYIEANTGKFLGFFDSSSSGALVSSSVITDDLWHHIVLQNDGNTTYMYVDGVLDGSLPDVLTVGNGSANNKLYFGTSNLNIQSFSGSLNDARIYNRILTEAEIEALFTGIEPVSVKETESSFKPDVSIYPNPTSNRIVVDLNKKYDQVKVEVVDVLGKSIHKESVVNNQYIALDITGQKGIYFVRIEIEGELFSYKVMKQ